MCLLKGSAVAVAFNVVGISPAGVDAIRPTRIQEGGSAAATDREKAWSSEWIQEAPDP